MPMSPSFLKIKWQNMVWGMPGRLTKIQTSIPVRIAVTHMLLTKSSCPAMLYRQICLYNIAGHDDFVSSM